MVYNPSALPSTRTVDTTTATTPTPPPPVRPALSLARIYTIRAIVHPSVRPSVRPRSSTAAAAAAAAATAHGARDTYPSTTLPPKSLQNTCAPRCRDKLTLAAAAVATATSRFPRTEGAVVTVVLVEASGGGGGGGLSLYAAVIGDRLACASVFAYIYMFCIYSVERAHRHTYTHNT